MIDRPQPKGCEPFSLQPVPASQRTGGAWPLFSIFSNYFINPGTLVSAGMMVLAGLSFQTTVLLSVIAVLCGMIPFLLLSEVGVSHGLPGQVFCRAVFGLRGSRWITSPLRLFCSVYWFAFQTIASALAIDAILRNCFQVDISLTTIALSFAILQALVATVGFSPLKWLSCIAFPTKLIVFILLTLFLMHKDGTTALPSTLFDGQTLPWHWPVIATWFNTIVCSMLTVVTDASDFSRYTRSRTRLWVGILSGSLVGTLIGAAFGAYAVIAGGASSINPFETITLLQPGLDLLALLILVILLDSWTINVTNLYTGGLSLCNTFPALGRFHSTLIVSVVAAVLSCFPALIHAYTDTVGTIGAIFAPIAGVLLAGFIHCRHTLDIPALYQKSSRYWYMGGFHPSVCLLLTIGCVIYAWLPVTFLPAVLVSGTTALVCCYFFQKSDTAEPSKEIISSDSP